jgi:hypothetical protein
MEYLWHIVNYMKGSDPSPVGRAVSDTSVDGLSTSATNERLCVLNTYIIREEQIMCWVLIPYKQSCPLAG